LDLDLYPLNKNVPVPDPEYGLLETAPHNVRYSFLNKVSAEEKFEKGIFLDFFGPDCL
jgi:hypothetical protein